MKSQCGSNRKKSSISLFLAIAAVLACCAVSVAAKIPKPEPDVVKLLPKAGDVKGWELFPDTTAYAAGKDLTEIYNGGFELYTKNGVLDAVQQMYRRKTDIAIVTIHSMTSDEAAAKFLEHWRKSDKKQPTYKKLKLDKDAYVYIADGATNAYLIRDKYFVTTSVYLDGDEGRSVTDSYLKDISTKIGKLVEANKPKTKSESKQ